VRIGDRDLAGRHQRMVATISPVGVSTTSSRPPLLRSWTVCPIRRVGTE
jgi:hypothetical protein